MSSEHLEAVHEAFRVRYEELQRVPERLKSRHGEERKKLLQDFHEKYLEANEMVTQMEEELQSAPPSFRSDMTGKLRAYRRVLGKLQTEVRSGPAYESARKGFVPMESDHKISHQSQRTLLLDGTQSLSRATDSVARSHHIAAETDAIGRDIVEVLGGQREQLERTRDRVVNTGENLSRSRKILRSMSRKVVTNKLLLAVIVLLEVAILAGLVYYKFFRK